ncbi:MAG: alpha/beta hydrolase [Oscillospiraceae bacterium]|nr:alpha/beta hydrolase [Oscillospiraceae bacterium]
MEFHTFGDVNAPAVVLIHGVLTPWQVWEPQIAHFQAQYRVIVPALDAHIEEHPSRFASVQDEARQIAEYLQAECGGKVFAVCGMSMGGLIADCLYERGDTEIRHLVLDGAPLLRVPGIAVSWMTRNYLTIIRKVQQRDPKTLARFCRDFLPEKYLSSFLKFADTMEPDSVRAMLHSVFSTVPQFCAVKPPARILFLHGTKAAEKLSQKSAAAMQRAYPDMQIKAYPGKNHIEVLIYEPEVWLNDVLQFLAGC